MHEKELLSAIAAMFEEQSKRNDQQISELRQELRQDIKNVQVDLRQDISEVGQKVSGLDEKVSTLDEKVSGLDEKVSGLDEKVSTLDEKVSGLDEKVSTLDEKVSDLEQNVTKIQVHLENDISKKIDALFEGHKLNSEVLNHMFRTLDNLEAASAASDIMHSIAADEIIKLKIVK